MDGPRDKNDLGDKKVRHHSLRMIRGHDEALLLAKFFSILWGVFANRKTWPPEPRSDIDDLDARAEVVTDAISAKRHVPAGEADPSLGRGLYRLAVLFACIAIFTYVLWEIFSTTAAVSRLSSTARTYPYADRCDENGNRIDSGQPNCVNLPNYVFINGPVLKAFRKACPGGNEPAEMLVLEKGKAPRIDIVRVQKALNFHVRNKSPMPCYPYRRRS